MSKTIFLADELLDHVYRNASFSSPATVYAALLTAVTDMESGSITETSYTGYARVAITFAAPTGDLAGRFIDNSSAITFGQKTDGGTETIIAVGVNDASTSGNWLNIVFIDGSEPEVGVVSDLGGDNIEVPSTGFVNDDRFRIETIPGAKTLPGGLAENTTYWVVGKTADTIQASATQGGGAIDLTSDGSMLIMPLTPVLVNQNDTPEFAANALKLYED